MQHNADSSAEDQAYMPQSQQRQATNNNKSVIKNKSVTKTQSKD